MVILALVLLGLCFGSFVNALVWRLRENKNWVSERSVCTHCGHTLAPIDLIPVFSWLFLRGKCRYCSQKIEDSPLVELVTPLLLVGSYLFWPHSFSGLGMVLFGFWVVFITGLVALAVYDIHWMLLPNKIIYPLLVVGLAQAITIVIWEGGIDSIIGTALSVLIGGGIFYVLFLISQGRWIGGGDIKLGALIGLILGKPELSLLMIFVSSLLGSLVALPLLLTGRAKRSTKLPFGPFLIAACIVVYIFGSSVIEGYKTQILGL